MAPLSGTDRDEVWQAYMEQASLHFDEFGNFSKWELLTAVGDVDDWIDGGSRGQVKNAISSPCDNELTAQQMDDIVDIVTLKRLDI